MASPRKSVYYAFGLTIESDWAIPCATTPRPSFARVQLRRGTQKFFAATVPKDFRKPEPRRTHFHPLADGSRYLLWKDIFEFHISPDSTVITAHSLDGAPEDAFRTYMLGHMLAYVLLGLGIETVHAASVVRGEDAVGFLGDSAHGKSTLSAAFLKAGWQMLSDDFLVLRPRGSEYIAYPGFPRIKLYERVARYLIAEGKRGTPMNRDHCPKMVYPLEDDLLDPMPIRVFYVLASPKKLGKLKGVRIEPLTPRQAYLEVTENSFNVRVKTPERLESQFQWATNLVKKVPFKRLSYPRVLQVLPEVIAAVQADLAAYDKRSALPSTRPTRTK